MSSSYGSLFANGLRRSFLRNLRGQIAALAPGSASRLVRHSAASADQLFERHSKGVPDRQGLMLIGLCSLVLASYRELVAGGTDKLAAHETVRGALLSTYRVPLKLVMRLLLWLFQDPVRSLSRISLTSLAARIFGKTMHFDQAHGPDRVELVVTHCSIHQFFVSEGEPLLTRLLCELDRNWMDEINSSSRPIRVSRPSTISTGGQRCSFVTTRALEQTASSLDVVLQRRTEVAASFGSLGQQP